MAKKSAEEVIVSIKLMNAVAKWAYAADDKRHHLSCVVFRANEMVATDGHRMVRVPIETNGLTFGLNRRDIHAMYDLAEGHGQAAPQLRLRAVPTVGPPPAVAIITAIAGVELTLRARDISTYPSPSQLDKSMSNHSSSKDPTGYVLDTAYLAAVAEVNEASALVHRGVMVDSWGRPNERGELLEPFNMHNASGVRFCIMPMKWK